MNSSLIESSFAGPDGALYLRSILPAVASSIWSRLAIIHGYGDRGGRYADFMSWMAGHGVACHAVDLRGQGQAAGRRAYVRRWEDYLDDLAAFLRLKSLGGPGPLFALGHSHGALVLAAAVSRGLEGMDGVAGCILSSPFFRSRMKVPRMKLLLGHILEPLIPWFPFPSGVSAEGMSSDPQMIAESQTDPLVTHVATPAWYFGQLRAQKRALAHAAEFRLPLLVLAGEADPLADPAAATEFYEKAGATDKSFKLYPGFLHELLREKERQIVFADVMEWMRRRSEEPDCKQPGLLR